MADAVDWRALPPDLDSLHRILRKLRAPGGCPWDREQTRETLSRCLAEECAELLDAIDRAEPAAICDELGDVMMNVVFQAVVAEERGEFTLRDVFANVNAKMIRRHAHVFGDAEAESATDVIELWEKIKSGENRPKKESILDGVPHALSALSRAEKLQKKAAKAGFDWTGEADIVDKISEELDELKAAIAGGDDAEIDDEIGDLLFAAVNLARFRKRKTAEELLRQSSAKFTARFHYIERELKRAGVPPEAAGIDRLDALWNEAKQAGL
jgi:MazG family protein